LGQYIGSILPRQILGPYQKTIKPITLRNSATSPNFNLLTLRHVEADTMCSSSCRQHYSWTLCCTVWQLANWSSK